MRDFRLYLILDTKVLASLGKDPIETAQEAIGAGVDILQLRAKGSADEQILKIGRAIKEVNSRSKALFLLNDRADLAQILDIDGVHLGQKDLSPKDARKILGKGKIIGLSTHSVKQAVAAEAQGADYIGVGPIFATATKPDLAPLGTRIIEQIKNKIKIPFVAIGGIDLTNLDEVKASGAQRVAVCRAIVAAKDVTAATREFKQRLK